MPSSRRLFGAVDRLLELEDVSLWDQSAPPVGQSDIHIVIFHGSVQESVTGVCLVNLALVLGSDSCEEQRFSDFTGFEHLRIQVSSIVINAFDMLMPLYAHAHHPL